MDSLPQEPDTLGIADFLPGIAALHKTVARQSFIAGMGVFEEKIKL